MATKVLTEKQKQNKFIKALEENGGEATAVEMVQAMGLPKNDTNAIARALLQAGIIEGFKNKKGLGCVRLVEDEVEEVAPKKVAPKAAPKAVAPPKKKAAPVEEDDDDDFDLGGDDEDGDDGATEDGDDDFDLGEDDDDDDAQDGDDDGQDGDDDGLDDDDEPEEVAPVKAKKKRGEVPPHKQFSLAFKPIDTLSDEELAERIDISIAAAQSLAAQDHTLVAEMIMRSVAKARRQMKKRS